MSTLATTLDNYQDGQSEQYIGEWMQKRQNRDEMVSLLATLIETELTSSSGHRYQ